MYLSSSDCRWSKIFAFSESFEMSGTSNFPINEGGGKESFETGSEFGFRSMSRFWMFSGSLFLLESIFCWNSLARFEKPVLKS